jgi:hypothetical protein
VGARRRLLAVAYALGVTGIALLTPAVVAGQDHSAGQKADVHAKKWTLQLTPDGHPDFQGIWNNTTATPLERPQGLGTKEFYTEQEMSAMRDLEHKRAAQVAHGLSTGTDRDVHYDEGQFGLDRSQIKFAFSNRTSLIVGPEGTISPLLPEAQIRMADLAARNRGHEFDGPEDRPLAERCIVLNQEALPMLPGAYNNNLQIVQGPGYVAIFQEMNHAVRIVPTDGLPHAPQNVRELRGDSRGHWEGNTLVIDVTNFTDRNPFKGSSEKLHVVERLTRVDEETILYRFTVEDPSTWAKSWTAELVWTKVEGPIYEFACHEGNYGIANTLRAARVAEQDAAKKVAK